jgi:hypothetical protein
MKVTRALTAGVALVMLSSVPHAHGRRSIEQAQRDPQRPATPTRDSAGVSVAGGSVISGRVVSADTMPRAVRRATVTLHTGSGSPRVLLTDDEGRFAFDALPAGQYRLMASKPGWVSGFFGARFPGQGPGATITVDGRSAVAADVTVVPGAVIAGRVIDQFGIPQQGARPQVLRARTVAGRRVLSAIAGPSLAAADDRGEFRIYGLPPGSYVVSATPPATVAAPMTTADEVAWALQRKDGGASAGDPAPPPGAVFGFAPVFYPGTTDAAAASTITLAPGEERVGIDFSLPRVPLSHVAGVLLRPDGTPATDTRLSLTSIEDGPVAALSTMNVVQTTASSTGSFTFANLRPGRYRLVARASSHAPAMRGRGGAPASGPTAQTLDLHVSSEIALSGQNLDDVALTLQPAATLTGTLLFEPHAVPPPDLTRVRIQVAPPLSAILLRTAIPDLHSTMATVDGSFMLPGIGPGDYTITASAPPAGRGGSPDDRWMVKSIQWRGQDFTDGTISIAPGESASDVLITFTARSAEVVGTLLDSAGKPAGGYYILVFPVDRRQWIPASRRFRPPSTPSADGKYRVAQLPAGDYYLAALTEFDPFDVYDEAFLEQLTAASIRVTLREGETKTQNLRIR